MAETRRLFFLLATGYSQIAQPRVAPSALDAGEPAAEGVERGDHAEPDEVDHPEVVAVTLRLKLRGAGRRPVEEEPFGASVLHISEDDGDEVNQQHVE